MSNENNQEILKESNELSDEDISGIQAFIELHTIRNKDQSLSEAEVDILQDKINSVKKNSKVLKMLDQNVSGLKNELVNYFGISKNPYNWYRVGLISGYGEGDDLITTALQKSTQ